MLKLVDITKTYSTATMDVQALKGISIAFRQNEFVSILGASGCGKTTLLNIIGGLDHYTSGDLFINGRSTKEFSDRDWDIYRNHRIGFVFQSYNLIPHQTVLGNVELALTIAGLDKNERIKKSKEALDRVGLKDLYDKKPNELSGGQCQRVAIARAIVNEPEILLADEPTGALDSVTSVQIMDLIKEISKQKLVIMVTHNPELAEKYSSRIIRLSDGVVLSDSNPYIENQEEETPSPVSEKAKMSFITAFKLSARNLHSKLKRTLMICFAASIGIIGVSSVLGVSAGVRNYISSMQDDMLSGNPISVRETALDLASLMDSATMGGSQEALKQSIENGKVNVNRFIQSLVDSNNTLTDSMIQNDITKEYVDFLLNMPKNYYAAMGIYYGIDIRNNLYTNIEFEDLGQKKISLSSVETIYSSFLKESDFGNYANLISTFSQNSIMQSPDNSDYILSQYDIISNPDTSHIAEKEDEIMIVVNDDTELTDILLAHMGYYSQTEFMNVIYDAVDDPKHDASKDKYRFTYDELLGKSFTWYPNNDVFTQNPLPNLRTLYPFTYNYEANESWEDGLDLKVTAILRPKESISYGCLSSGIYYTSALTKKIIQDSLNSEISTFLKANGGTLSSVISNNAPVSGIFYTYDYSFEGTLHQNNVGVVGSANALSSLLGTIPQFGNQESSDSYQTEIYTLDLRDVGGNDLPSRLDIYPIDFDNKYLVTDYLNAWNDLSLSEYNDYIFPSNRSPITYSDNLALIINLINRMVDIVTVALVAFTALSLVVSTVMIGIITYVSVIERIKEIGVIRALGGRKKDVSHLFNAETFIIGLSSGLIGIGVTYLLCLILNAIVKSVANITFFAILPPVQAIIVIVISILLTLISGLIPAKIAARKNPVDALRSE